MVALTRVCESKKFQAHERGCLDERDAEAELRSYLRMANRLARGLVDGEVTISEAPESSAEMVDGLEAFKRVLLPLEGRLGVRGFYELAMGLLQRMRRFVVTLPDRFVAQWRFSAAPFGLRALSSRVYVIARG